MASRSQPPRLSEFPRIPGGGGVKASGRREGAGGGRDVVKARGKSNCLRRVLGVGRFVIRCTSLEEARRNRWWRGHQQKVKQSSN